MVDTHLPKDLDGLRWIFLDLNSYFAAVEQAHDPALVGRPVAVAPVHGDGGTVIAASQEAKMCGVRTGHRVGEARALCAEIQIVPARARLYVHVHKQILEAVETVLPVDKVCSIDEMRFRLLGEERIRHHATELAGQLKRSIAERVSAQLTCSIGIAPNPYLAKLATEFQKPDGLVVIGRGDLPTALDGRRLTVFPGINRRMEARLIAHGIFRSDDLVRADLAHLRRAFGSRLADDWYGLLRGFEVHERGTNRKSLGHSHVLPPEFRTPDRARDILVRLIHKACARLRSEGLVASKVAFSAVSRERAWHFEAKLPQSHDAIAVTSIAATKWHEVDLPTIQKVGVTFFELSEVVERTPSLFDSDERAEGHGDAVDAINQKFGKNAVFVASLAQAKDHASEKIAFQKTELFREGKGDNEWVQTRTP